MERKRGFTLVELLVVIAIISILAAIVVPNVARWIQRARMTRALTEVKSIELSLTKMLADADRSSLNDFFNPDTIGGLIGSTPGQYWTADQWRNATTLYTRATYALLREGRAAATISETVDGVGFVNYGELLTQNALTKLGTSYLDIGFDPWGNIYRIFPGPWSTRNGPNIFRIYLNPDEGSGLPGRSAQPDDLTNRVTDPDTEIDLDVGFPAPRDKVAFIWSTGANLISGQAIYQPPATIGGQHPYAGQGINNYEFQDDDLTGGGDDINNWDSNRTWERFYN